VSEFAAEAALKGITPEQAILWFVIANQKIERAVVQPAQIASWARVSKGQRLDEMFCLSPRRLKLAESKCGAPKRVGQLVPRSCFAGR